MKAGLRLYGPLILGLLVAGVAALDGAHASATGMALSMLLLFVLVKLGKR